MGTIEKLIACLKEVDDPDITTGIVNRVCYASGWLSASTCKGESYTNKELASLFNTIMRGKR